MHVLNEKMGKEEKYYCIRGLLTNYGLEGTYFAEKIEGGIDMCPGIKYSCCKYRDQMMIYENWNLNKEKQQVEGRIDFYGKIYYEVLKVIEEIQKQAQLVQKLKKNKRVDNCKILSSRMLKYNFKSIIPKIKEGIEDFKKFTKKVHKGFYCGLCDSTNHKYINLIYKTIQYNKGFCRQIIKNNYVVQTYFGAHLTKYVNIAMNFLNQCTYDGRFMNLKLPQNYELKVGHYRYKTLQNCKLDRNKKKWFWSCRYICENFRYDQLRKFYIPNLKKYSNFIIFSKKKLRKIKKYQALYMFGGEEKKKLNKKNKKKKNKDDEYFDSSEDSEDDQLKKKPKTKKKCPKNGMQKGMQQGQMQKGCMKKGQMQQGNNMMTKNGMKKKKGQKNSNQNPYTIKANKIDFRKLQKLKRKRKKPFFKRIPLLLKKYEYDVLYKAGFDEVLNLEYFKPTYKKPPYKNPFGQEYLGIDPLKYIAIMNNKTLYNQISKVIQKRREKDMSERAKNDKYTKTIPEIQDVSQIKKSASIKWTTLFKTNFLLLLLSLIQFQLKNFIYFNYLYLQSLKQNINIEIPEIVNNILQQKNGCSQLKNKQNIKLPIKSATQLANQQNDIYFTPSAPNTSNENKYQFIKHIDKIILVIGKLYNNKSE